MLFVGVAMQHAFQGDITQQEVWSWSLSTTFIYLVEIKIICFNSLGRRFVRVHKKWDSDIKLQHLDLLKYQQKQIKVEYNIAHGLTHIMTALHRFGHLFTDMHCIWSTRSTRDWIQDCLPAWQPNPLIHVGGFDVAMLTLSLSAFLCMSTNSIYIKKKQICSTFFS